MRHYPINLITVLLAFSIASCSNPSKIEPATPSDISKATSTVVKQPDTNSVAILDQSPLDVIYFPADYPKLKMIGTIHTPPVFRVLYSRPQLNGRQIFGTLIKDGEPWRLGANEATEIEFFRDVEIQKTKVPAGRYTMYCIPEVTAWTIVLNAELYSWGLKFNKEKDLFKFTAPILHDTRPLEVFTIDVQASDKGADLWFAWDSLKVYLPITF